MQLYVGNKNYSSWSMRAWVLMRHKGIAFEEVALRLAFDEDSAFKQRLREISPAGRVPVLVDEGFAVWDTLAIAEYLAERHPDRHLWPAPVRGRARARCLFAEMHSGFQALRNHFPMNIEASLPEVGQRVLASEPAAAGDLKRIVEMWTTQLDASGGPFLFGDFGIVDAFYAPVCTRLRTYALPVPEAVAGYIDRVHATAAVRAWVDGALAEQDFLDFDEPYRRSRG